MKFYPDPLPVAPGLQRPRPKVASMGGIWYWYPSRSGFDLLPFTQQFPEMEQGMGGAELYHQAHYADLVKKIAQEWDCRLPTTPTLQGAVPRGRVYRNPGTMYWTLEHGGEFSARYPKQEFGLTEASVKEEVNQAYKLEPGEMSQFWEYLLYSAGSPPQLVQMYNKLKTLV